MDRIGSSAEELDMDHASGISEATRAALNHSQIFDPTTTGRRTGRARRIEIFMHHDGDQLFVLAAPPGTCVRLPSRPFSGCVVPALSAPQARCRPGPPP